MSVLTVRPWSYEDTFGNQLLEIIWKNSHRPVPAPRRFSSFCWSESNLLPISMPGGAGTGICEASICLCSRAVTNFVHGDLARFRGPRGGGAGGRTLFALIQSQGAVRTLQRNEKSSFTIWQSSERDDAQGRRFNAANFASAVPSSRLDSLYGFRVGERRVS